MSLSVEQALLCPVVVGRDAPLADARARMRRAGESSGSVLLVSGEAGVGKSRLLSELMTDARSAGFLVLGGACFEADQAVPYAPLLDLVRTFAIAAPAAVVAHVFGPAASELVALWPELAPLVGDPAPRAALEPEQERRRLLHAIAGTLLALTRTQPVLLAFEDLHWSDDASLDLIRHLSRSIASQRVLLALTYRSDEVRPSLARLIADLDRARVAADVSLARLPSEHVATMVRAIFGARVGPGDDFARALHGFTDGNPFFVEEVLKGLVLSGDLSRAASGEWQARSFERVRVPRTATEAVRRRLSGLSVPARELASVAAVAGRRFDFRLLLEVGQSDERELLALVKELIAAQLVADESPDHFVFRHALTCEAIYAELLARERVVLHRDIAAAIEHVHAGALDGQVAALAYHTFEAGEWARAREWATRAADHAIGVHAPREALSHLDRAFEAATHLHEEPSPALQLARGRASETLGNFDAANAAFSHALEGARRDDRLDVTWDALHALGLLWAARDYARAGRYRHDALELARSIGDPVRIARSLNRVGNWHINIEQAREAIHHHEEALSLFESFGDPQGVSETVDLIAMSHLIGGDEVTAALHFERSIAMFETRGDRRSLANALALLAVCGPSHHTSPTISWLSDRTAGVLASEDPVHLARDIDWRAGEVFCLAILSECLGWRGEYDRALPMAHEALRLSMDLEHLQWQAYADCVLGWLHLDLASPAAARMHLERGYGIATRLGSLTWIRWTGAALAVARLRAGDPAAATKLLSDIAQLAGIAPSSPGDDAATLGERQLWVAEIEVKLATGDAGGALNLLDARLAAERRAAAKVCARDPEADAHLVADIPRLLLLRARALSDLDRLDDAEEAVGEARAAADAQGARPLRWQVEAEQARICRHRRQRTEARRAVEAGRAIAQELAALVADDELRRTFERAVDDALPASAPPTKGQAAKAANAGLTRREREVAQLVASGKSNRAIARALELGERTVESHVAAALAKLGFSSRTQLAAWVVERGLGPAASSAQTR